MANIVVDVEKGLQVATIDILAAAGWIKNGFKDGGEVQPTVVATLATLLGALAVAVGDTAGAVAHPINIELDIQTVNAILAVWPDLTAFLAAAHIKL